MACIYQYEYPTVIHIHAVCLSEQTLSGSPALSSSLTHRLLLPPSLCERSLGAEPSRVCFFEWIPDVVDETGWGRSCVSGVLREKERGGREIEMERVRGRNTEREKQPGREGAGGLVALHNTRWSSLARRTWYELQQWGTSFTFILLQGQHNLLTGESREEGRAVAATVQVPGEESGTKERFRKRSPRKHVSNTHTRTHTLGSRKNPWTCSASSGCEETGELFLVL